MDTSSQYRKYLPLLYISICFWGITYYLLTHFYPIRLEDMLLPNSYLVILLPFFTALSSLLAYILLDTRKGVIIGTGITLLIFLKLQNIVFEVWWLALYIVIFFLAFRLQKSDADAEKPSEKKRSRLPRSN